MSQSSLIAATLLAGFVLYLAANDRLKTYAAVLWGDTKAPLPSSQTKTGGGAGISGPGAIAPGVGGAGGFADLLGGAGSLLESAGPELLLLGGL